MAHPEEIASVAAIAATAETAPIPGLPSLYEIQLIAAVSSLPDTAIVEPPIAALILRRSEQTLARMRSEGSGPPFYQSNEGRGRNSKVTYVVGELREWHRSGSARSTMDVAKGRGMCFASLQDLVEEQPFWSKQDGMLHSPALVSSSSGSLSVPSECEIVWIPMIEAMAQPWEDNKLRRIFYDAYIKLLSVETQSAYSVQEESDMRAGIST